MERGLAGDASADPHSEVLCRVHGDLLGTAEPTDMLLWLARAGACEP